MWKYTSLSRVAYICDYCGWEVCHGRDAINKYRGIIRNTIGSITCTPCIYVVGCNYGSPNTPSIIAISTIPVMLHDNIVVNRNRFLDVFKDSYIDKVVIPIDEGIRYPVIPLCIEGDVAKFILDYFGGFGPH